MGADKGGAPSGELGAAIDKAFGSFDEFKKARPHTWEKESWEGDSAWRDLLDTIQIDIPWQLSGLVHSATFKDSANSKVKHV